MSAKPTFGAEHFGQMFEESSSERELLGQVETRLLLLASMIDPPAELGSYVEQAIAAGIDWTEFQRLAVEHRLLPFVTKSIGSLQEIPAEVGAALRAAARRWTMRSLNGAGNAKRARAALSELGIASLVLKGPALAEMVYGDPAARMFIDIDLFVAPADLPCALQVMQGLGYEPTSFADWTLERLGIAVRSFHAHDVELRAPDGAVRVELHWRAVGHADYDRTEAALAESLTADDCGSSRVPFAAQVLIHGALHSYRRIGWIRDAAALCEKLDDDEWGEVLTLADADASPNAVLIGPYLAHRLFGVAVPTSVAHRILERADALRRLGGYATMTAPERAGLEEPGALRMRIGLRDRRRDKVLDLVHKLGRLSRGQMSAATLEPGLCGGARRLAAQLPKFQDYVTGRLAPRLTRSLTRRAT